MLTSCRYQHNRKTFCDLFLYDTVLSCTPIHFLPMLVKVKNNLQNHKKRYNLALYSHVKISDILHFLWRIHWGILLCPSIFIINIFLDFLICYCLFLSPQSADRKDRKTWQQVRINTDTLIKLVTIIILSPRKKNTCSQLISAQHLLHLQ